MQKDAKVIPAKSRAKNTVQPSVGKFSSIILGNKSRNSNANGCKTQLDGKKGLMAKKPADFAKVGPGDAKALISSIIGQYNAKKGQEGGKREGKNANISVGRIRKDV